MSWLKLGGTVPPGWIGRPISDGIDPVSRLLLRDRSIHSRLERLPNSGGIDPVNWLPVEKSALPPGWIEVAQLRWYLLGQLVSAEPQDLAETGETCPTRVVSARSNRSRLRFIDIQVGQWLPNSGGIDPRSTGYSAEFQLFNQVGESRPIRSWYLLHSTSLLCRGPKPVSGGRGRPIRVVFAQLRSFPPRTSNVQDW